MNRKTIGPIRGLRILFDLSTGARAQKLYDELAAELFCHYMPRRKDAAFISLLRTALAVLIANLLRLKSHRRRCDLFVPGSEPWYTDHRLLLAGRGSFNSFRAIVEFLLASGYVTRDPGKTHPSQSYRRQASIRPTDRFWALVEKHQLSELDIAWSHSVPTLELRAAKRGAENGRILDFNHTPELAEMAKAVVTINNLLARHWPDIELTKKQMRDLSDAQYGRSIKRGESVEEAERASAPIDFAARALTRIFNNSTFADGGRFYRGWWQGIPGEYRRYITIDGERTVEVDYSAIHPTILYHELGLAKPEDPYDIGMQSRDAVKRAFNALLNARGQNIRPVVDFDPEAEGMPWRVYLRRIKDHFAPFRRYFGTGYGLKLQRIDSDIAEAVMLHFAARDIPLLPVHDSFLIQERHAPELVRVMKRKFSEIVGAKVGTEKKALTPELALEIKATHGRKTQLLVLRGVDAEYAARPFTGPYGEYNRRQAGWKRGT